MLQRLFGGSGRVRGVVGGEEEGEQGEAGPVSKAPHVASPAASPAPSIHPPPAPRGGGGGRVERRSWWGRPAAAHAARPGWLRGCLFKRSEEPGPEGCERVSMAPRPQGLRGRGGPQGSSHSRRSRGVHPSGLSSAWAAPWPPLLPRSPEPGMPGGAPLLPSPPPGHPPRQPGSRAPSTNFCPASPTSAAGSDPRSRSGSRCSSGCREQLRPAGMLTPRLWLWCWWCTWVAAGWPPGSALQLRPDM